MSVLCPSHTPTPAPCSSVTYWYLFPASSCTAVNLMLSLLCSRHLVSRSDNRFFICPAPLPVDLAQTLGLAPVSLQFWVSCVPERQQQSTTSKTWALTTAPHSSQLQRLLVTRAVSLDPRIWPARFPKASTLAGALNDKN